jgi:hypothetical protein
MKVFCWIPGVALGVAAIFGQGSAAAMKVSLLDAGERRTAEVTLPKGKVPLSADKTAASKDSQDNAATGASGAARSRSREADALADRQFKLFVLLLQIIRAPK